jgi:hypothetical protein
MVKPWYNPSVYAALVCHTHKSHRTEISQHKWKGNPIVSDHPVVCHICDTKSTLLCIRTKPDMVPCYFVCPDTVPCCFVCPDMVPCCFVCPDTVPCCFMCPGHAVAHAVICQPLTAEAQVQSETNPCEICGGQSGIETGFSPRAWHFHSVSFHQCPVHLLIHSFIHSFTYLSPVLCGLSSWQCH